MNTEENTPKGSLGSKMKDFSVTPPEKVWEGVAAHLDAGSRRGKVLFWIAVAAGIALAVSIGLNLNWYFSGQKDFNELVTLPGEHTGEGIVGSDVPGVSGKENTEEKAGPVTEASSGLGNRETGHSGQKNVTSTAKTEVQDGTPFLSPEKINEKNANQEQDILRMAKNDVEEPEFNADTGAEEKPVNEQINADEEGVDLALLQETEGETVADTSGRVILALGNEDFVQDDFTGNEQVKETNWTISAALSPLYSYRDAEGSLSANSALNTTENGLLAYAGELMVAWEARKGLELETGVVYSRMGLMIGDVDSYSKARSAGNYDALFYSESASGSNKIYTMSNSIGNIVSTAGDAVANSYGGEAMIMDYVNTPVYVSVGESPTEVLRQNLEFIEIPFNLKYKIYDREFAIQLIGGMSTNILVGNSVSLLTGTGAEDFGYIDDLRTLNYSGNAGLGFIYHLGDKLDLNLEPRFRYFLNSVNTELYAETRPYSFGIFTGLSYLF